ncbi:hypothetical protein KBY96_01905 [Cyanobium sp. ATX 6A2]|uniref:hypothetical protein n=1 Tax=Cyanobium sp. ATX 6A2 TaxID=2823700 RepID=UPI0020CF02C5|nr:hypothetical protein [Cyanobium sp. ATX 6A2]MCP9886692.1 hypothetical protein [Cyanobium sp. ATX 6A2]
MFVIEALHPDGWRPQGRANLEYWAYQEAQTRCCSDGRNYRIVNEDSNEIVALINTSSCRTNVQPAAERQRSAAGGA